MRNKFYVSLVIVCLLSLMTLGFASAALTVTQNVPVQGGNYSSLMTLNCTTNIVAPAALSFNMTFFRSASTGGAATTVIATVANSSATQTEFVYAYDISALTNSASYNFTCRVDNGTTQLNSSGAVATLDSADPTPTLTLGTKIVENLGSLKVTYSCADSIDSSVTTSAVLNKGQNSADQVSISSSPTTLSGSDLQMLGLNDVVVTCTDDSGNVDTKTVTFTIETEEETGTTQTTERNTYMNSVLLWVLLIAATIIIFLAIIYFATKK